MAHMSKHTPTPGPWHHDTHTQNVVATVTPEDGGDIICTEPSEGGDSPSRRRWDANARLIAAAPDLLAALEECTELMETIHKSAISRARAAIAKSRGEA